MTENQNTDKSDKLTLKPLALYEDMLLNALAFFRTKRDTNIQAHHCLSMYLRQSEERIMKEVEFYSSFLNMEAIDLLNMIYKDPEKAQKLINNIGLISPVADDESNK